MKRRRHILIKVFVIVFGLLFTMKAEAQTAEGLMSRANTLYNESAYDSAAAVYEDIIGMGYSSAVLYYNLGNTYYKLRDYPMAIYYYEKSLKLDPNNEDTKHNIDIANAFISDKIEAVPTLFLKNWWNNLSNSFSANTWAVISLIILVLLLASLFIYLTTKTRFIKKSMFFSCIILIIILICSFTISAQKYNYIKSQNEGIIITPTITVKSSPSSTSVDLFVLHEGSKVKVLDRADEWEKIKIANGSIGWIPSSSVIKY